MPQSRGENFIHQGTKKLQGIHIVANFYECQGNPKLMHDEPTLRQLCLDVIRIAGLTTVGELFHPFEGGGVTGCLVLSESHLAVHTWPELGSVTLDIYACNYTRDNSDRTRQAMAELKAQFQPKHAVIHEVPRDQQFLYEHMNADYGFFARSNRLIENFQTPYQHLEVHQTPQFGKLLRLDGYFMTSEKEEFVYHETMVHPALCAQEAPRHVLIIGGGDGGAAEEVLKHPTVETVTLIELDEAVIDVSKKHLQAVHQGVFDHPKLKVLCQDGLAFIQQDQGHYDHIVLDLPDPLGPAEQLYQDDFLRACLKRLSPTGTLNIHTGSPWAHPQRLSDSHRRLRSIFKHVDLCTVFIPLYGTLWSVCVCSQQTPVSVVPPSTIDERLAQRGIQGLQHYSGTTHQALFALPPFVKKLVGA